MKTTGFRTDEVAGEFVVTETFTKRTVTREGITSASHDEVIYKGTDQTQVIAAEAAARERMFLPEPELLPEEMGFARMPLVIR